MSTTTTVHCRRCRASFELPSLSATERVRIAEVVRAGQHIEAMRLLRQPSSIELRDAKGVELHITGRAGKTRASERWSPRFERTLATATSPTPNSPAFHMVHAAILHELLNGDA